MNALLVVSLLGILALVSETLNLKKGFFFLIVSGLAAALVLNFMDWNQSASYFGNMMKTDNFALVLSGIMIGITLLWFIVSHSSIRKTEHETEHFSLILFALAGGIVMSSFSNIVMLFLGIEILSVSMYILAGSKRDDLGSNEAALKYFVLGSFSTGFLLFGIALIYGVTGSFNIEKIGSVLSAMNGNHPGILIAGVLLMLISLCFKIAAFPFHFWAPDVYEGSPDIVSAYMGTVVKVAAIGAFYRLFSVSFVSAISDWSFTLCLISALSILTGNILAIFQKNLKRMLAYSGIAHAGYLLLAIITLNPSSSNALLVYTIAYALATFGAFAILILVSEQNGNSEIASLNGLAKKNPAAALFMTIAMLSLAGIPPTIGFFGKYMLFTSALQSDYFGPVFVALAGTLISIYFYFRVIHAMYIEKRDEIPFVFSMGSMVAVGFSSLLILATGIFPDLIIHWLSK